jgi:hypothetical protein
MDALTKARKVVNGLEFGTPQWEAAMQKVRALVSAQDAANPKETFCSIDSGQHPTRLSDGRIVSWAR